MAVKQYRAILFDFDGVLAKTMDDNLRAWQAALGEFGVFIKPEDYFVLEGMKLIDVAENLCRKHGLELADYGAIVKKKEEYYFKNHKFEFYPGVEDFIGELHAAGVLMALVSAAFYSRIKRSLPDSFLSGFGVVISGEKTLRGKPWPDPYLAAAAALKVSAEDCVVIENAPLGIQAAKSAGAYCIAICSTLSEDKLVGADEIVKTFSALKHSGVVEKFLDKTHEKQHIENQPD